MIEIFPRPFDFDVRFIDAPRVIGRLEMGAAAFVQLRAILQHPEVDRTVVNRQVPLCHHLLQISITQGIAAVPPDIEQNDFGLKVLPLKQRGIRHELGTIGR